MKISPSSPGGAATASVTPASGRLQPEPHSTCIQCCCSSQEPQHSSSVAEKVQAWSLWHSTNINRAPHRRRGCGQASEGAANRPMGNS